MIFLFAILNRKNRMQTWEDLAYCFQLQHTWFFNLSIASLNFSKHLDAPACHKIIIDKMNTEFGFKLRITRFEP